MFWIGLIIGVVALAGTYLLLKSDFRLKWWQWLIAALAVLALFAATQHLFGSFAENEVKSAWIGFGIFAVIASVLGILDWQFIIHNRKS